MYYRRLALLTMLGALAGIVMAAPPAAAQTALIQGTVFLDGVIRNNQRDLGEPGVPGVTVELWHTTSFGGVPLRIRSTQTNALGQYQFLVDPINGPLPDFGCYQVRAQAPAGLGGGVQNSPELCQVPPNGVVTANFPLASGGTNPPPTGNQAGFFGKVFRDTIRRNFLQDPGEPGVPGLTVEVWSTTSITGQPTRITSTRTDAQGRYQLLVNPISGPLPDLGCYEVRLLVPTSLGSTGVIRSQQFCQLAPGQRQELDFALAGVGTVPPPPTTSNRAPTAVYIQADSGVAPGGVIRVQALGIDPEDDCLTYTWSATGGTFVAREGSLADWQAPNQPGQYQIVARVTDPQGRTLLAGARVTVAAGRTFNQAPNLDEIVASTLTPAPGQVVRLSARAGDPDNNPLTNWFHFYNATASRVGPFDVLWQAPSQPGIYRAYGVVYDNQGSYGFNIRELSVNSAQALNRNHPSYGRAGQLLIESFGRLMWVGINDPQVAQQAAALANGASQQWVIGRIVPDNTQRHCFYLNPTTVSLAEVTAEGIQTTIEQVERRPAYYAPGGGGGFDAWAISARLIQFVPAQ